MLLAKICLIQLFMAFIINNVKCTSKVVFIVHNGYRYVFSNGESSDLQSKTCGVPLKVILDTFLLFTLMLMIQTLNLMIYLQ